ncbi:DMT family transporter [Vibrio sp. V39_P1S14PM300]|uniref:DMT family transporter n=1 Tax=Vibrio sp. V39_P1S14PM300 TaxID=1938690 RepID=UPI00137368FB|nr:DMT family transporter [Vibrio sp. V39_P1S14PM300]NAX21915.1 EamA family transporter [Vibrio sp. V39_P1S14PM300]
MRDMYFIGVLMVMLYIGIASTQSVVLNIWLVSTNVFVMVALSFTIATGFFSLVALLKQPQSYRALQKDWKMIVVFNVVTVCNWLFYFLSVKYLEPSVAVTITQGFGPVVMTVWLLARKERVSKFTQVCHFIVFCAIVVLCVYVFSSRSTLSVYSQSQILLGLLFALLCCISITATVVISKKFATNQVPATTMLSIRFPLLILVSAAFIPFQKGVTLNVEDIYAILAVSLVGVCTSIYVLQKGIEMTSPLAVSTSLAVSPLVVLGIQRVLTDYPPSRLLLFLVSLIVLVSVISLVYEGNQVKIVECKAD